MIKELRLVNWKSFEDSKLFVDPLTFLIGTNASGKSNILDAFQFLQRIASGISIQSAINGDRSIHSLRGGTEWIIRHGQDSCSLGIKVQLSKTDYDYDYEIEDEVDYEIEMRKIEQGIEIVSEKLKGNK